MKHRTLNLALLAVGIVASGCGVVGSPADLDGEWILTGGTHDGAAVGRLSLRSGDLGLDYRAG